MVGFRSFREKYFQDNLENSLYRRLSSEGQTPKTLLIGCSDSRVDPAILTEAAPGELFIIRNVANLVPPFENRPTGFHGISSAIEFAVVNLKVENVIVLGHRQCGGIRALVQGGASGTFISRWMTIAEPAVLKVKKENPSAEEPQLCRLTEMESIKVSLENLKTFPFVQEAISARSLNLLGVYFDLELGSLWEYDGLQNTFSEIKI